MDKDHQKVLRDAGLSVLRGRYADVAPVTGQGIQEGTRVTFYEGTKKLVCAIKVTTGGRISFARKGATWGTLDHVDRVLYVRPITGDASRYEALMLPQESMKAAFDQNHKHAVKIGIDHLPAWLNADHEDGDRFVGSGFGKHALWKEVGEFSPTLEASLGKSSGMKLTTAITGASAPHKLTIEEAKSGIAASLGISPDKIEIVIRA
jgi:hypothetical protein